MTTYEKLEAHETALFRRLEELERTPGATADQQNEVLEDIAAVQVMMMGCEANHNER